MITKAAADLAVGDTLTGAVEGEILIVNLVTESLFALPGYVDALVVHPRPIDGETSRWETFELYDQVTIA